MRFSQDLPLVIIRLLSTISATTRKPRVGEVDKVNYFFVSKEEFEDMIANNKLLEYAQYVDNYYGTPLEFVNEKLNEGINVILNSVFVVNDEIEGCVEKINLVVNNDTTGTASKKEVEEIKNDIKKFSKGE